MFTMIKALRISAGIIIAMFFLTLGANFLPLVPEWQPVKSVLSIALVLISLILITFNVTKMYRLRRQHQCKFVFLLGVVVAGIFLLLASGLLVFEISGGSWLGGTALIKTVPIGKIHGKIYIFETASVPDGVESTSIAFGSRWYPLQKQLYVTDEVFADVKLDSQYCEVYFIDGSSKKFNIDSLQNNQ